jgi:hypothetical protein
VIAIEKEPFTLDLAAEILPLAQKCWEESTRIKADTCAYYGEREFAVEPDMEVYERLAAQGSVVLATLRDDTALKGYVIGWIYSSLHHKRILCGHGDSIYIEPSYRSYTAVVAEKFEQAMKDLKVQAIGWPTHIDGPVYGVLKARGYVGDDIIMEKRLCV